MRILKRTPLARRHAAPLPPFLALASAALLASGACSEASTTNPATVGEPAPIPPQRVQPQMTAVASTPVTPWWAGTPYPYQPVLQVRINGLVAPGVSVRFVATNGATIDSELTQTDAHGTARAGSWVLGSAGPNAVMARIAYPWSPSDSMTASLLAVTALPKPQSVTEYALATVNGQRPPPTSIDNDILGGFLRLGSDGTFEWGEDDIDLGTPISLRGAGTYSIRDSLLVFRPVAGSEAARFPSDSGAVFGDTLSTSFIKVLDVGLDPLPTLIREQYVRRQAPTVSRAGSFENSNPPFPSGRTTIASPSPNFPSRTAIANGFWINR